MANVLPSRAQVVIVGGGIVGCSIAYHLVKNGIKDVVLLERKQLTSGTTWHAAGILGLVRPSENQTRLLQYAAQLFSSLEEETGQSTGYIRKGTLYLALNDARLEFLKRTISYAGYLGVAGAGMASHDEIKERWPLLNLDGVVGGSFLSGTGQLNPVDATQAFAKGARMSGAQIFEKTKVTKVLTQKGQAIGVETEQGAIQAPTVVLACGMWTRTLAAEVGVNVPLHAAEHFYIVSEPVEGLSPKTPCMFCADERAYYKEDAGKLLVGTFEQEATPWATEGIPESSEFESLPADLDRYAEFLDLLTRRVPVLATAGIRTFFAGPESFTPDGRELMGETPEVRNLFVCAGFNSHGIMSSPGVGKVMAHWIKERYPPFAMTGYDLVRMMPFQGSRRYLFERTKESMGHVMDIPWPGKQMATARGVRRFPVHRELLEAGAQMGERYGWEVPLWYAPPGEDRKIGYKMGQQDWFPAVRQECQATRDAVALYDQSNYARFLVQGADACRVLNWICSNEVDVAPGQIVYSQWLNSRGGIEADVTVNRFSDDCFLIVSAPPSQVRDVHWFRRHVPDSAKVAITDVTTAHAMFAVMGARSREMLQHLTDVDLSNSNFPFATGRDIDLGYAKARAARLTYVGELGYELMVSTDMAGYVYERLLAVGREFGLRHAGSYALGACRLERGYRHFGHDITEDDTPNEAGLSFAVAMKKPGGFLGQDALLRQRENGPPRYRIVQVRLDDASVSAPVLQHNEIIWRDGQRVGTIRSGGWGFRLQASLGMGYLHNPDGVTVDWINAGHYEIEVALERYPARVQLQPFYDPAGSRVKV